jgi:hypothetical protein
MKRGTIIFTKNSKKQGYAVVVSINKDKPDRLCAVRFHITSNKCFIDMPSGYPSSFKIKNVEEKYPPDWQELNKFEIKNLLR